MAPALAGALAAVLAAGALLLATPGRARLAPDAQGPLVTPPVALDHGVLKRWRGPCSVLAGAGAWAFLGGSFGVVAAPVVVVVAWVVITRAESPASRRRREEVARDLPHLVTLLACALGSGAAPDAAVRLVCAALPGPAADLLAPASARLALGGDPVAVWSELCEQPEIAPLGRALSRAHRSGASVVTAVERLADDLTRSARAGVEDRARAVGVKAAVPLGLCLLPAFVLIGIVPLAAGLLSTVVW